MNRPELRRKVRALIESGLEIEIKIDSVIDAVIAEQVVQTRGEVEGRGVPATQIAVVQQSKRGEGGLNTQTLFPDEIRIPRSRSGSGEGELHGPVGAAFEAWWLAWPQGRKVGKAAARRIWMRKRPSLIKCLEALKWQTQSKQWREGFIPLPTTYLNQERWDDEKPRAPAPRKSEYYEPLKFQPKEKWPSLLGPAETASPSEPTGSPGKNGKQS